MSLSPFGGIVIAKIAVPRHGLRRDSFMKESGHYRRRSGEERVPALRRRGGRAHRVLRGVAHAVRLADGEEAGGRSEDGGVAL